MDLSEVKQFEQKVGVLKLSEAIRIGARIRPKRIGDWFRDGRSCALGAAWEGWGKDISQLECYDYDDFRKATGLPDSLVSAVTMRNDVLNWSRERIADWLEHQGL